MEDEKQKIASTIKVMQLMAAIWTVTYLINWLLPKKPKKSESEKLSKKENKVIGKVTGAPTTDNPGPKRL